MESTMTEAKLQARLSELEEYRALVRFIAADYHEFSAEKVRWQRDDWQIRCRALLAKHRSTEDPTTARPLPRDSF